jgi:RNA polymerase sigma-70 factor (ECF subfamily)
MRSLDAAGAARLEQLDDAKLALLAATGDTGAFKLIMTRHNRQLFRLARGVLLDDAEAEDVVQETYTRAAANLAHFRGEARLSTWLTRIALNEALGRLRRRRPVVAVEAIEAAQPPAGQVIYFPGVTSIPDPETATAVAQIRRMIEAAVDALPETFRLVLVMRDIEGMSTEDTAQCLDLRVETVKTRLFRARQLLRKSMNQTLAATLVGSFPFDGERCGRFTERVLEQLGYREPC